MLPNPYHQTLKTVAGTNLLERSDELTKLVRAACGNDFDDGVNINRRWKLTDFFAPVSRIGLGLRARLVDELGFVTFCNQRDFEVLAGIRSRGDYCAWLDADYLGPLDRGWIGLCLDTIDLEDDLFERELTQRGQLNPGVPIPSGTQLERLLHSEGADSLERLMLNKDVHPRTGRSPDLGYRTLSYRWMRIGRERASWRALQSARR